MQRPVRKNAGIPRWYLRLLSNRKLAADSKMLQRHTRPQFPQTPCWPTFHKPDLDDSNRPDQESVCTLLKLHGRQNRRGQITYRAAFLCYILVWANTRLGIAYTVSNQCRCRTKFDHFTSVEIRHAVKSLTSGYQVPSNLLASTNG